MKQIVTMFMVFLIVIIPVSISTAGEIRGFETATDLTITHTDTGCTLHLPDYGTLNRPGYPELPARRIMLALPPGVQATSVTLTDSTVTRLECVGPLRPVSPSCVLAPPGFAPRHHADTLRVYSENMAGMTHRTALYPESVVAIAGTGSYRQVPYACIEIRPVQYDPVTGELIHHQDITYTVTYESNAAVSDATPLAPLAGNFLQDARCLFANFADVESLYTRPADLSSNEKTRETADYIILTSESLVHAITASSFVTWKQNLNFRVKIVTIEDPELMSQPGRDLAEQIRNYLRANYLSWNTRYLLIVGSTATIPMRYCYPNPQDHSHKPDDPMDIGGEVPTDYFYADLSLPESESWDADGDGFAGEYGEDAPDFAADIYVGRIPTNRPAWITYTLDKLAAFEQDTGSWKNTVLHGGAFWYVTNEDNNGMPAYDGATCMNEMETNLMTGMTVSHYSEQEGLETSVFDWPGLNFDDFTADWRNGSYGIVNWGAHGSPSGAAQKIWAWDDGDLIPETSNPNEFDWPFFISTSAQLDDDYLCYFVAISCLIGCPEASSYGNIGIDFLSKPGWGPCAAVLGATRIAYGRSGWPENPGGSESTCYEFNRYVIDGPDGPEPAGDALYDAKLYCHTQFPVEHFSENWTQFNYNLYGDPSQVRLGIAETPTPLPTATPTPVTSPTPQPTSTPSCNDYETILGMPDHMFSAGSPCGCWVDLCNPDAEPRENVLLFVVLDVYGALYCAPSFSDNDCYPLNVSPGHARLEVLPMFAWPDGCGAAEGLKWYAGMVDALDMTLLGGVDTWEFGYR